jgi:hypothetical protein
MIGYVPFHPFESAILQKAKNIGMMIKLPALIVVSRTLFPLIPTT